MSTRVAVSNNFFLDEFIDPRIYDRRGPRSIELIDFRLVLVAQFLRDEFKIPIVVNNWWNNGQYRESGLRRSGTPTGAEFSQHKFGRAIDVKFFRNGAPMQISEVKDDFMFLLPTLLEQFGITTVEDFSFTPTWIHMDTRNYISPVKEVVFVKP